MNNEIETVTYHADNWQKIAGGLDPFSPFTAYIQAKSFAAVNIGKPGRKISETVEDELAKDIKRSAGVFGLEEAESKE